MQHNELLERGTTENFHHGTWSIHVNLPEGPKMPMVKDLRPVAHRRRGSSRDGGLGASRDWVVTAPMGLSTARYLNRGFLING